VNISSRRKSEENTDSDKRRLEECKSNLQ